MVVTRSKKKMEGNNLKNIASIGDGLSNEEANVSISSTADTIIINPEDIKQAESSLGSGEYVMRESLDRLGEDEIRIEEEVRQVVGPIIYEENSDVNPMGSTEEVPEHRRETIVQVHRPDEPVRGNTSIEDMLRALMEQNRVLQDETKREIGKAQEETRKEIEKVGKAQEESRKAQEKLLKEMEERFSERVEKTNEKISILEKDIRGEFKGELIKVRETEARLGENIKIVENKCGKENKEIRDQMGKQFVNVNDRVTDLQGIANNINGNCISREAALSKRVNKLENKMGDVNKWKKQVEQFAGENRQINEDLLECTEKIQAVEFKCDDLIGEVNQERENFNKWKELVDEKLLERNC